MPAGAVAPSATALFRVSDPRLDELSGLAVSVRNRGLLYAQNDSGDQARFFALDARTGAVVAECHVPGAQNHDWEDLATGNSAAGRPSVWLADIGDNDRQRASVQLYRVDEPTVAGGRCQVGQPDVWQLRYPDGAHDAESLIVQPGTGRAYLVTKELLGHSEVFAIPPTPSARVQELTEIGDLQFHLTNTPGGPNPVGQLTATGASMSADGRLLAVRTYTDAYLWPVADGDVAAALRAVPTILALPAQPQGEGIAVDADSLLIDSEKVGSTVYSVPIPAARMTPAAGPSPAAATATSSVAAPSASASSTPERGSVSKDAARFIGPVALVLVLAGALALGQRRRRH